MPGADRTDRKCAVRRDWPPEMMVYPAHYGTARERRPDGTVGETLARLLEDNEGLRITDPGLFREWVSSKTASFPEAYRRIKGINILEIPSGRLGRRL